MPESARFSSVKVSSHVQADAGGEVPAGAADAAGGRALRRDAEAQGGVGGDAATDQAGAALAVPLAGPALVGLGGLGDGAIDRADGGLGSRALVVPALGEALANQALRAAGFTQAWLRLADAGVVAVQAAATIGQGPVRKLPAGLT